MAGNVVGIEIKNSSTVRSHDFKGLETLAEEAGNAFVRGIVLYSGESAVPFSEKLIALPINTLWT